MVYKILDIKEKHKKSRSSVAKAIRKKVVNIATSKHIYHKATTRVFEEY